MSTRDDNQALFDWTPLTEDAQVAASKPADELFGAARASAIAAKMTLKLLGYTYHGGELWKPPLGKPAAASGEAVAEVTKHFRSDSGLHANVNWLAKDREVPIGTKLYTHPAPAGDGGLPVQASIGDDAKFHGLLEWVLCAYKGGKSEDMPRIQAGIAELIAYIDKWHRAHAAPQVAEPVVAGEQSPAARGLRLAVLEEVAVWYETAGYLLDEDWVAANIRALK